MSKSDQLFHQSGNGHDKISVSVNTVLSHSLHAMKVAWEWSRRIARYWRAYMSVSVTLRVVTLL